MQGLIVLKGIKIGHVANVDYADKTNIKNSTNCLYMYYYHILLHTYE